MKTHYIKIFILILINNLLFSVSLGGRVILDPRDPYFNFAGQSIIITDASNTFGSVKVSSTGNFTFPNAVTDNKPHGYSITINETPNNNSFICSLSDNQVTGMVYLKDKTDLTIACRGEYKANIKASGLVNGDMYTATLYQDETHNETLTFTSNETKSFSTYFYNWTLAIFLKFRMP